MNRISNLIELAEQHGAKTSSNITSDDEIIFTRQQLIDFCNDLSQPRFTEDFDNIIKSLAEKSGLGSLYHAGGGEWDWKVTPPVKKFVENLLFFVSDQYKDLRKTASVVGDEWNHGFNAGIEAAKEILGKLNDKNH